MKEENKKRINKLIIPFTRRTLSFLTATTMIVTGTTGCKEVDNNENTSSIIISDDDISSEESIIVDTEDTTSEITSEEVTSKLEQNNASSNVSSEEKDTNPVVSNNENITSIPSVSTPSTESPEKPVDTPSVPSTPEVTMPAKLTVDNINDVEVFKHFASDICADTRGNFGGVWTYFYNGKEYTSFGTPTVEFRYVLTGLNYEYMDINTLESLFDEYSLDDFKRFNQVIELLIVSMEQAKKPNNWNELIINSDDLNYMNQIDAAYIDYLNNNKNIDKLRNLLDGGMKSNNPIVRNYFYNVCYRMFLNDSYDNYKYHDLFIDLSLATEVEMNQFSEILYNNIKSKTKVLK